MLWETIIYYHVKTTPHHPCKYYFTNTESQLLSCKIMLVFFIHEMIAVISRNSFAYK